MEGIPVWFVYASLAALALLGVALVLGLIAGLFLLAGQSQRALTLFAAGVVCASIVGALAALQDGFWEGSGYLALALLLAGAGQFVVARRAPRAYLVALACVGGCAFFAVAANTGSAWLIPDLRGSRRPFAIACSLMLALVGLAVVVGAFVAANRDRRRLHSVLEAWENENLTRTEQGSPADRPRLTPN
jgi:hypothetical protein